jgi:hypothetical protein
MNGQKNGFRYRLLERADVENVPLSCQGSREQIGYSEFPYVHNGGFFKLVNGRDADWTTWVLRNIPDQSYHEPTGIWGTVREFADKDGDGLPDYSPSWDQLVITEASFGTSRLLPDSDGDGVSDLEEAIRDGLPRETERGGTTTQTAQITLTGPCGRATQGAAHGRRGVPCTHQRRR